MIRTGSGKSKFTSMIFKIYLNLEKEGTGTGRVNDNIYRLQIGI